ncbi:hypothetical protein OAB94_01890 [Flavobacteriaceae bacterium]|nr:hypothetical protein [Flavobacteriaceae bacterium]MDB9980486.1 hypothetical protein [bacterium]
MTIKEIKQADKQFIADLQEQNIHIDLNWKVRVYSSSVELILVDENNNRIFGGDITVNGHKDYNSELRDINLNLASMSDVTDMNFAACKRIEMSAYILKNWISFKAVCEWSMDDVEALERAQWEKQEKKNKLKNA